LLAGEGRDHTKIPPQAPFPPPSAGAPGGIYRGGQNNTHFDRTPRTRNNDLPAGDLPVDKVEQQ
jgi:hypothetical protein